MFKFHVNKILFQNCLRNKQFYNDIGDEAVDFHVRAEIQDGINVSDIFKLI